MRHFLRLMHADGDRPRPGAADPDRLGPREIDFIGERDGFYVASAGPEGWPYVQYRGGPAGFLRVLDPGTLAFADFRGNRQHLTVGNVAHDDRVSLFLMDYAGRRRLKILARAEIVDAGTDPDLAAALRDPSYAAVVERAIVFRIVAFDWNCPQHIIPRFTAQEFARSGVPGA